ncbi:hepatitis A virus cellular receptor 1 homolog isoform X2 [Takifugu rubripes]|uniref:hepatitis A virus cellular receptor 1 homolog isoform X2 n=1 Tax=Takifugu rubripes TaxID=31033 RepID=UPI001145D0BA|nr:hepatitis A virus cellular receptor 1 homolog isoform X2 [Takifugu rubripes]
MKIALLLVLLSVSECSTSRQVNGYVGQNVTLQCSYKSQSEVEACWNRDWFSGLSCRNSQLISSDGHKVIEATRASSRYQLLGPLDKGDVSLTILNLTEADAGTYGCRVEIPGWFNDEKHYITLVVKKAEQTTTSATSTSQTVTATTAFSTAAVQLTSTKSPGSSSLGPVGIEENGTVAVVLLCVLFGLIVLITAGGLFIITRKWGKLRKIRSIINHSWARKDSAQKTQHFPSVQNVPAFISCHQVPQVNTPVEFHSGSSALQLHSRAAMVENIYDIDGGGDGGEYQYLP